MALLVRKALVALSLALGLPSALGLLPLSCSQHSRNPALGLVPPDLSYADALPPPSALTLPPLPNVEVHSLEGGALLGVLLWAFVLHRAAADPLLPAVAGALGRAGEPWLSDFQDGFAFLCPPPVELARALLFLALGWAASEACVRSFDGDQFWGWSTGASLAIPAGLLSAGRPKRLSRADAAFQVLCSTPTTRPTTLTAAQEQMRADFRAFAADRLRQETPKTVTPISDVVSAFRRDFRVYRTAGSEAELRRAVRRWAPGAVRGEVRGAHCARCGR